MLLTSFPALRPSPSSTAVSMAFWSVGSLLGFLVLKGARLLSVSEDFEGGSCVDLRTTGPDMPW